jgi:membrane-associated protease RseP (regulator of RpoE activity)
MKKLLASFVALFLLAGFAWADEKPAAKDKETAKPQVVKFELVPSGHFIVKVKLDDHGPYNLIFDTGAPTTLITPRIAKEAKLIKEAKDKPLIPLFGMMGQVKIKDFQVGDVKAGDVAAMIMDHPTVALFSKEYEKKYGVIDGIVGFPFFAQYKMTVDYSTKEMTFVPNGYKPTDIMTELQKTLFASLGSKPEPRVAAPAGLWGIELGKKSGDDEEGVDVSEVHSGGAAAAAGLKEGDRILTIDGRWTDSVADAYIAAGFVKPGKSAVVTVKRDGKEVKLTVTPKTGL